MITRGQSSRKECSGVGERGRGQAAASSCSGGTRLRRGSWGWSWDKYFQPRALGHCSRRRGRKVWGLPCQGHPRSDPEHSDAPAQATASLGPVPSGPGLLGFLLCGRRETTSVICVFSSSDVKPCAPSGSVCAIRGPNHQLQTCCYAPAICLHTTWDTQRKPSHVPDGVHCFPGCAHLGLQGPLAVSVKLGLPGPGLSAEH